MNTLVEKARTYRLPNPATPRARVIVAKVLPSGAQKTKTVKDWGEGRCLEQTRVCKHLLVETVSFAMTVDQRIAELIADGYEIIERY